MKLQYSATGSNGEIWIDCQDRFDEFIQLACAFTSANQEEITKLLESGGKAPISPRAGIKYVRPLVSEIRDADSIPIPRQAVPSQKNKIRCLRCGQTGYAGQCPFQTMPGSGICDGCWYFF